MEDVPVAQWAQYVRTRSAVYHADRSSADGKWIALYSAPQRRWWKAYRISAAYMRVEFHESCPCRFS